MPHLGKELYRLVLTGHLPPRALARVLHDHLLEVCLRCSREWRAAAPRVAAAAERSGRATDANMEEAGAEELAREARRVRLARRWAREDLVKLLATPAEAWPAMIERARTRFRSRAVVELVVEHARELTRAEPRRAIELLELVPRLLLWTPGGQEAPWGRSLAVRAAARRANALRVVGDFAAAERNFAVVRRRLAAGPVDDTVVYAEVASLEASLHRDQRRYDEAGALLDEAVLVYHQDKRSEELARVLIQRAEIAQHFERHQDALVDLGRARRLLDPVQQTFLYLCTVIAEVPTLLDVGRPDEAEHVLLAAEDAFAAAIEPWWALRFRYLQGRAAFGQGHHERALRLLGEARQGFLDQRLPHDAAAASLDLALVHLDRGDAAEARRLARLIAPIFRSVGVEREALATLRVFQEATAEEARRHLTTLRTHLAAARSERSRRTPTAGG